MRTRITPRGAALALATLGLCTANLTLLAGGATPQTASAGGEGERRQPGAVYESDVAATGTAAAAPSPADTPGAKDDIDVPTFPSGSFDLVENGYRRIHRSETIALAPDEIGEWIAAGKGGDLVGNARIVQTLTDHLPADWMSPAEIPAGARVDSYGNAIVNTTAGLPEWAQRDVDALRADLADRLLHLNNLDLALAGQQHLIALVPAGLNAETYQRDEENLLTDRFETEHVIGNFLGQSVARGLEVGDIAGAAIDQTLSDTQVNSLASYLHHYEDLKAREAQRLDQPYVPTAHPAHVTALLESRGWPMHEVLALENPLGDGGAGEDEGGVAGIVFSCQLRTPWTVGMTNLSGATTLWSGSAAGAPYDDVAADVPIGFRFYFYPCNDSDQNTSVRVSTNGYISFFQQAGGSLNGTDFGNDALPSANDPDGFAAPWWDDLIVANQGGTDSVSYKTEGAVGNRLFTVQWSSISRLGGSTSEFHWFQVQLLENYTRVRLMYDTLWLADTVDNATSGVENFAGIAAACGFNCGNANSADPNSNFDFNYPVASNNQCASATCIEENQVINSSNFGAEGVDISSCASNDYADVWYRYAATANESCTVSLCNSDFDTTVAVYSSCGGAQVACDDDACTGLTSTTTFSAVAGNAYLIRVAGFNGSRGAFSISISGGGATGDVCQTCHSTATNGFFGSTANNNSGCNDDTPCALNDTIDEWFCYTAPANGTAFAHTCDQETDLDTTLAVFAACGTSPTSAIVCNDDWFGCSAGGLNSRVQWNVHSGVTYRIRLAGYQGDTGDYVLHTGLSDCPADIAPAPTGDGEVAVDDLIEVILAWGACSGCRPDFAPPGGNGQVNVDDLVAVILSWGPCP